MSHGHSAGLCMGRYGPALDTQEQMGIILIPSRQEFAVSVRRGDLPGGLSVRGTEQSWSAAHVHPRLSALQGRVQIGPRRDVYPNTERQRLRLTIYFWVK